ncbi:MAG: metal-dependent hydrolase [Alphaproteobacteria bacterium]|nr:metal-dependent hydrolase [Alphaproteobacteria bacterium]
MDPLSQAVLGATFSMLAVKRPSHLRAAALAGVIGGMLPDADVLIRSDTDPLLFLSYHRHFTHSLAFIPLGGLIAAALCWPILRRQLGFLWILLYATLGYATHGLLDACTNYGTHLAWPFSDTRVSWNVISIIDPIYTITLLACVILAVRTRRRGIVVFAAVFALGYLGLGYIQRERADHALEVLAKARGHAIEQREVKPSFANLIVWRAQYRYQGTLYFEAFRAWKEVTHLEGESIAALPESVQQSLPEGSVQRRDLERFAFFSDGWLAVLPDDPHVIADMRFAMLPMSAAPLWGIRIAPDNPGTHVEYVGLRRSRSDQISQLWRLIIGQNLENGSIVD